MAPAITLVDSGGWAVSEAPPGYGTPFETVEAGGIPATLVASGGYPVNLDAGGGVPGALYINGYPVVMSSYSIVISGASNGR